MAPTFLQISREPGLAHLNAEIGQEHHAAGDPQLFHQIADDLHVQIQQPLMAFREDPLQKDQVLFQKGGFCIGAFEAFLERLSKVLSQTGTGCYACVSRDVLKCCSSKKNHV